QEGDREQADDDRHRLLGLLLARRGLLRRQRGGLLLLLLGLLVLVLLVGLPGVRGRAGGCLDLEAVLALRALDLGADGGLVLDRDLVLATGARNLEAGHGVSNWRRPGWM